ncbi:hypothetical protein HYPSUDRAFT_690450 [Hypholoma sublateritium FD-334 SS-4]|uniref:Rhodopsin domain-containing protein n=1 Tax=Hypholoma sublateritium (strain FD-334 SS-4) TaxID=945553 RepID=A0A0D2PIK2_HYPSF|nr:hypothetical protein HYPSUDRAFT_690450 [Hypholoma sublateritium FD-334 SS-4]
MIPNQDFLPWKICISVLHGIAIFSTCLRLEHRRRTRKLWWDDYATIVPLLTEGLNISVLWLRFRYGNLSMQDKVLYSFINSFVYNTLNWWSRISLALAVLRITPPWAKPRYIARCLPMLFIAFWVALSTAMLTTCAVHTNWQRVTTSSQVVACGPAYRTLIASTILDSFSDVLLIAIPLYQLWHISSRTSERRLIRLVFSASVITLMASIGLCIISYGKILVGPGGPTIWLMSCQIFTAVSILTSNLLVLICWIRRFFPTDEGPIEMGDIHITPHWTHETNKNSIPTNALPTDVSPASHTFQAADVENSGSFGMSVSDLDGEGYNMSQVEV